MRNCVADRESGEYGIAIVKVTNGAVSVISLLYAIQQQP